MVNFIQAGGKERPIFFGFSAMRQFCEEQKWTLQQLNKFLESMENSMDLDKVLRLIYIAFKDAARKQKEPFEFSFEEVVDWLDERDGLFNEAVTKLYRAQAQADAKKKRKPKP